MILDKQTALERIEQDLELYDEICQIFRDDVPRIVAELKSSLACNDITTATRHAHSIKSAASNIGALKLCETARLTESTLRNGETADISMLIEELDQNMTQVLAALD